MANFKISKIPELSPSGPPPRSFTPKTKPKQAPNNWPHSDNKKSTGDGAT
jgi:hypothetical protein